MEFASSFSAGSPLQVSIAQDAPFDVPTTKEEVFDPASAATMQLASDAILQSGSNEEVESIDWLLPQSLPRHVVLLI